MHGVTSIREVERVAACMAAACTAAAGRQSLREGCQLWAAGNER